MSKRVIKNVVMIILIILLSISMYFTVNGSKNSFEKNREKMKKQFSENGEMPILPEGEQMRGNRPEAQNGENSNMQNGERPEMPTGGMPEMEEGQVPEMPEGFNPQDMQKGNRNNMPASMNRGMRTSTIILCYAQGLGMSLLLIYLILSKFNKLTLRETFANKSNIISYVVLVILVTAIIVMLVMLLNKNNKNDFENFRGNMMPQEENVEKQTKAEDVESGENVNSETINLEEHTSNITITDAGNYTLTGSFGHTVLVNANGDVTLNLENAKIENKTTAALANISTNALTINLVDGTTNMFSDGGSSEYDACLYSAGPLTIQGSGTLEVYGNQEEGEGIATETNDITINGGNIKIESADDGLNAGGDGGTIKINDGKVYIKANGDGIDSNKNIVIDGGHVYTIGSSRGGDAGLDADEGTQINGGEVIALGSDMLEKPKDNSKQKYIATNLNEVQKSGSEIILKDSEENEVISFTANEDFRTLIISSSKLVSGKYSLYNGEEIILEVECK